MKTKLFLLICTISILFSCGNEISQSNEYEQHNPGEPLTIENQLWLPVFKLTHQRYKENVLATEMNENGMFGICQLTELEKTQFLKWWDTQDLAGKSPYIELIDDYLLLDWHWYPLYDYLKQDKYNANLHLAVLTSLTWTDITDICKIWEDSTSHDHNAIELLYQFKVKALDDYRNDLHYQTEGWENHLWYSVVQYAFMRQTDSFPNGIEESKLDSLQSIYINCLKTILRDNNFHAKNDCYVTEIKL